MSTITKTQQPLTIMAADLTFADTGTITIGNLPPNAGVAYITIANSAAWNSSSSDAMTIGYGAFGSTAADVDYFETAIDLQATGEISLTRLGVGKEVSSTANVPVTITITSAGTGLSTGAGTVIVAYFQR